MSANALRMVRERSCADDRCTDGGSCASNAGSSARTASVTSMVLVPGWRMHLQRDRALLQRLAFGFV